MSLIKCPECGKEISDRAESCIHCGCPIGPGHNGILRVELKSFLKLIGNMSITVVFDEKTVTLRRGFYYDFVVPADGKEHKGRIICSHGLFDGREFSILLNSGESKKISITYNDGHFGANKWEYREEFFTTK